MARWKITPSFKKSLAERSFYHKDGKTIIIETGWRSGTFYCETEGSEAPVIEEGADLFDCGYDVEMEETWDGCWEDREFVGLTDEEEEAMNEWLDENSFLDLEEEGWIPGDTEMIITCDPVIEFIED